MLGLSRREVSSYDGSTVYVDGEVAYELGNFLGGGAAGVVYEAIGANGDVALKVLHPLAFKLTRAALLARYAVAVRGRERAPDEAFGEEHVTWLVHPGSKAVVAAYHDPELGSLRELPLPLCFEVWGESPPEAEDDAALGGGRRVNGVEIPRVPKKFVVFLRARRAVFREIHNMSRLSGGHVNVLQLEDVLELVNDSKSTIFLVLELASGGELFDRILLDEGCDEETARYYFRQLLSGVAYCHERGVCHRDLKPENLLLSAVDGGYGDGATVLKIADFGLSALFQSVAVTASGSGEGRSSSPRFQTRRLKSIVGSPHYVAPEVLRQASVRGLGYDGSKADAWSLGVILYAMLAGNLPFGQDLLRCPRFEELAKWRRAAMLATTEEEDNDASEGECDDSNGALDYGEPEEDSGPEGMPQFCQQASPTGRNDMRVRRELEQRHGAGAGEGSDELPVSLSLGGAASPRRFRSQQRRKLQYPSWFFPRHFSEGIKSLLCGMLNPDPCARLTVTAAQAHPWAAGQIDLLDEVEEPTVQSIPPSCPPRLLARQPPADVDEEEPVFAFELEDGKDDDAGSLGRHNNVGNAEEGEDEDDEDEEDEEGDDEVIGAEAMLAESHIANFPLSPPRNVPLAGRAKVSRSPCGRTALSFNSPPLAPQHIAQAASGLDGVALPELLLNQRESMTLPSSSPPGRWRGSERGTHASPAMRRHRSLSPCPTPVTAETCSMATNLGTASAASFSTPVSNEEHSTPRVSTDSRTSSPPSPLMQQLKVFKDLVKRSTRFTTSVPAVSVLQRIADIVAENPYPMRAPYRRVRQHCVVHWDQYRLDVMRGSVVTSIVRIFLMREGARHHIYMVEFLRGQVSVFEFKAFYQDVRKRLTDLVKEDSGLVALGAR